MSLDDEKKTLLQIIRERALFHQPVRLSSGKESSYYVDGKQVTLSSEGSYLIARQIFEIVKKESVDAIGGPTIGADPIVGAVLFLSYLENFPLKGFIVRKEPKKHGMQRYIEGPALKEGSRVAIIDDVVTTGESVLRAARAAEEAGGKVVKVIAIVDRLEGARERLESCGFKFTSLFTKHDLNLSQRL